MYRSVIFTQNITTVLSIWRGYKWWAERWKHHQIMTWPDSVWFSNLSSSGSSLSSFSQVMVGTRDGSCLALHSNTTSRFLWTTRYSGGLRILVGSEERDATDEQTSAHSHPVKPEVWTLITSHKAASIVSFHLSSGLMIHPSIVC